MEIRKVMVDGKEMDFVISSDDEVEKNNMRIENDTLDLTNIVKKVNNILEGSEDSE